MKSMAKKNRRGFQAKKQGGLTIIELLIGIAAIAAFIAAVLLGYRSYKVGQTVKDHTEDLVQISTAVENAFMAVDRSYTNVSTAAVVAARVVPENMVRAGIPYNPWGGTVAFNPATITTAGDAFTITSNSVPADECQRLAEKLVSSFNIIDIGGTVIKDAAAGDAATATEIQTNCGAGVTSITVTYQ